MLHVTEEQVWSLTCRYSRADKELQCRPIKAIMSLQRGSHVDVTISMSTWRSKTMKDGEMQSVTTLTATAVARGNDEW